MGAKRNKLKGKMSMLVEQNLRLLKKLKLLEIVPQTVTKKSEEKRFRTIQRTLSKLQTELRDKEVIIKCLRGEIK